jgi:hypothetical protein
MAGIVNEEYESPAFEYEYEGGNGYDRNNRMRDATVLVCSPGEETAVLYKMNGSNKPDSFDYITNFSEDWQPTDYGIISVSCSQVWGNDDSVSTKLTVVAKRFSEAAIGNEEDLTKTLEMIFAYNSEGYSFEDSSGHTNKELKVVELEEAAPIVEMKQEIADQWFMTTSVVQNATNAVKRQVKFEMSYNDEVWLAFGLAGQGDLMDGGTVLTCSPDGQQPEVILYKINGYSFDDFELLVYGEGFPAVGIVSASCTRANGAVVLSAVVESFNGSPISEDDNSGVTNTMIVARGYGDALYAGGAAHEDQKVMTFNLQPPPVGVDPYLVQLKETEEWYVTATAVAAATNTDDQQVKFELTYKGEPSWVALGTYTGSAMFGGRVVVYSPGSGAIDFYFNAVNYQQYLAANLTSGPNAGEEVGIVSVEASRSSEGLTTLTVVAKTFDGIPISSPGVIDRTNAMIFALGQTGKDIFVPSNFAHQHRATAKTTLPIKAFVDTHVLELGNGGEAWSVKTRALGNYAAYEIVMTSSGSRYLALGLDGGLANAMDGALVVVYEPMSNSLDMYQLSHSEAAGTTYELLDDLTLNSTTNVNTYGIIDVSGEAKQFKNGSSTTTLRIVQTTDTWATEFVLRNDDTKTNAMIFARGYEETIFAVHQNHAKGVLKLPDLVTPSPVVAPSPTPIYAPTPGPIVDLNSTLAPSPAPIGNSNSTSTPTTAPQGNSTATPTSVVGSTASPTAKPTAALPSPTAKPTSSPLKSVSPTPSPTSSPIELDTLVLGERWSFTSNAESKANSNQTFYRFTMDFKGNAWLGFGMGGPGMIGGQVVIYNPKDGSVKLHSLVNKSSAGPGKPLDGVEVVSRSQAGGVTSLTVLATSFGGAQIASGEDPTKSLEMIFARGPETTHELVRHEKRTSTRVDLVYRIVVDEEGTNVPTSLPTSAPTAPTSLPTQSPVNSDGSSVKVLASDWTLESGKASSASSNLGVQQYKFTMVLPDDVWMGIGMAGNNTKSMIGGSVLIFRPDTDAYALYRLTGKVLADVQERKMVGIQSVEKIQDNGKITLTIVASSFGDSPIVSVTNAALSRRMIVARGKPKRNWGYHDDRRTLPAVSLGGQEFDAPVEPLPGRLIAHIALMVVSWGVLIPIGVIAAIARRAGFGASGGRWFKIHRFANTFGVVLGSVGSILGYMLVADNETPFDTTPHFGIGIAVFGLGLAQAIAGMTRPHIPELGEEKSGSRKCFEAGHRAGGILTFVLAEANLVIGASYLASVAQDETVVLLGLSVGSFETVVFVVVGLGALSLCGAGYAGYVIGGSSDAEKNIATVSVHGSLQSSNDNFQKEEVDVVDPSESRENVALSL